MEAQPPSSPFDKGEYPSLEKRGEGRFSNQCQFYLETLYKLMIPLTLALSLQGRGSIDKPLPCGEGLGEGEKPSFINRHYLETFYLFNV